MKARLRDHLPLRFKYAVTLARRALHCERLEPRCLLHGLPLAADYTVSSGGAELVDPPVIAHVHPATALEAPPNPHCTQADANGGADRTTSADATGTGGNSTDGTSTNSTSTDAVKTDHSRSAVTPIDGTSQQPIGPLLAAHSKKESSDEADDSDGMPPAEGEGQVAPPQEDLNDSSAGSSNDGLGGGIRTPPMSDSYIPSPSHAHSSASTPSSPTSHGSSTSGMPSAHGSLTGSLTGHVLSDADGADLSGWSGDAAAQQFSTGSQSEASIGNTRGLGLSLNLVDMQVRSLQSQSLQLQAAQLQRLYAQSELSVAPFSASTKPVYGVAGAQSSFSNSQRLANAARADDSDAAAHAASQTSELAADTQDEDHDVAGALGELRARMEQVSRERNTRRALAVAGMHEEVARHAQRYIRPTHLRVREGSDGLVELAIEQSSTTDDSVAPTAPEHSAAAAQRTWGGGSMGLYREFDLAIAEDKPTAELASFGILAVGLREAGSDAVATLEAIDAAHAEGEPDDVAGDSAGEATLPIGLLALASLLAISRHRFTRKQSADGDA